MIAMLLKEMCGIKRKNAVFVFIMVIFLCQVHFVVKSHFSLKMERILLNQSSLVEKCDRFALGSRFSPTF